MLTTRPAEARKEALAAADLKAINGDPALLTRLAALLLSLGERQPAESCAERAAAAAPADFFLFACELARVRGVLAAYRGEHETAERLLREAHEMDPTDEGAAQALAAFLSDRSRSNEALNVIDRTLTTPITGRAGQDSDRRRLRDLREKIDRRGDPGVPIPPQTSSPTSPARGPSPTATASTVPTRALGPSRKTRTRTPGATSDALAGSLRLLKLDRATQDPARLALVARGFVNMGMRDAARLCVLQAAKGEPTDPVVLQQLDAVRGVIALLDGDYDLAETLLRAAHRADPSDPLVVRDLCALLAGQKRHGEAVEIVDCALDLVSRDGVAGVRADLERTRRQVEATLAAGRAPTVSFSTNAARGSTTRQE